MKNGVVLDRKCTDVLMCAIFTLFFCGLFATAAYGYAKGDPSKLITPFDSDGIKLRSLTYYRKLMWIDGIKTGKLQDVILA